MERSGQKEYIDLGQYTDEEYENCLEKLDRVGRFLGGDRATLKAIKNFNPKSILDVGCGGGYLTYKLARRYPEAQVVGIDINPKAIAFAKKKHQTLSNLQFQTSYPGERFDVVTSCLVCHHMSDEEIIAFVQKARKIAKKGIVINDLQRSRIAWILYRLVHPFLLRDRLTLHDGLLSIKRAFKKRDWVHYLNEANIEQYRINWCWAFRWVVVL